MFYLSYNVIMRLNKIGLPLGDSIVLETGPSGKPTKREVTTPAGEKFIVEVDDPTCEQVLGSGAIQNFIKGRFVKGPPKGGIVAITSETAQPLRKAYYTERAEEVVRSAIARHTKKVNWEEGADSIAGRIIEIAMEGGNRDAIGAAEFVWKAAGLMRDRRVKQEDESVQVSIPASVARDMLNIIRGKREVIDGEFVEED